MTINVGSTVTLTNNLFDSSTPVGTTGEVINLDCGATTDNSCCVEVRFPNTTRFVSVDSLEVTVPAWEAALLSDATAEPVETLEQFKKRVAQTFLAAAERAGVSGVPALLETLGITPEVAPTRRSVFLTVCVDVDATSREEAQEIAAAAVRALDGARVTDQWGGDDQPF